MRLTTMMLINLHEMLMEANPANEQKLLEMLNSLADAPKAVQDTWVDICGLRQQEEAFKNWTGSVQVLEAFVRTAPEAVIKILINPDAFLPGNLVLKVLEMTHKKTSTTRMAALEAAKREPRTSAEFDELKAYALQGLTSKPASHTRSVLAEFGDLLTEDEIVELAEHYAQAKGVVPVPWGVKTALFTYSTWSIDLERVLRRLVDVEAKHCTPEPKLSDSERANGMFTVTPSQRLRAIESTDVHELKKMVTQVYKRRTSVAPVASFVPEISLNPALGDLVKLLDVSKVYKLHAVCPTTTVVRNIVEHLFLGQDIEFRDFVRWDTTTLIAPLDVTGDLLQQDLKFLVENLPLYEFMKLTGMSGWLPLVRIEEAATACIDTHLNRVAESSLDGAFWALLQDVDAMFQTVPIADIIETLKATR